MQCVDCGRFIGPSGNVTTEEFELDGGGIASVEGQCLDCLCADCIVARSKDEVDRLRGAIAEHRRLMHMRNEGRRISSVVADRDLWAALEEES